MKRFKTTLVILIALGSFANASAQTKKRFKGKPIEAGITFGGSNYMGDLSKGVATNETHLMGGLICRFNYNDFITLRGNAVFGQISGNDQNFKSNLVEFSAIGEWNILGFGETTRATPATPFLFAGIGVFKFNPRTQFNYMPGMVDAQGQALHNVQLEQYDKEWIELQTLGTEGQGTTKYNDRKRYNLTQVSIPLGIGYKQQVDEFWAWGIELGARKTFTDYLDDVSLDYVDDQIVGGANGFLSAALKDRSSEQIDPSTGLPYERFYMGNPRGSTKGADWYMFLNVTITRKIIGGKTVCFSF